jgi:hypothetical protein
MIMSAPTRRSPWMTLSPIPPRPKTTHFAPGSTLAVFWRVERNDVIAFLHRGHAGADVDNNAGALVAEDRGKEPLGVCARKGELVSVADSRRFDLHKHFAGRGPSSFTSATSNGLPGAKARRRETSMSILKVAMLVERRAPRSACADCKSKGAP